MAFAQLAATGTSANNSAATSHTVNMPAGISTGDLLVCYITSSGTSADTPANANWTAVDSANGSLSGSNGGLFVFKRVADGTEGATQTFTTSLARSTHTTCERWTGASGNVESGGASTGSTSTPDPGALTPSWGAKDTVWVAVAAGVNSQDSVSTYPSNYSNGRQVRNNSASFRILAIAYRELNATSEDPGAFDIPTTADTRAFTVGIEPAGAGGTPVEVDLLTPAELTLEVPTGFTVVIEGSGAVGSTAYRQRSNGLNRRRFGGLWG